jgi:hypothetical protein
MILHSDRLVAKPRLLIKILTLHLRFSLYIEVAVRNILMGKCCVEPKNGMRQADIGGVRKISKIDYHLCRVCSSVRME